MRIIKKQIEDERIIEEFGNANENPRIIDAVSMIMISIRRFWVLFIVYLGKVFL